MMHDIHNQQDWGSLSTPTHWSLKAGPVITNQNRSVYLTVVWMLGIVSILSLVGIIGLSFMAQDIPQALIALGSVAVGALGSLFTHTK